MEIQTKKQQLAAEEQLQEQQQQQITATEMAAATLANVETAKAMQPTSAVSGTGASAQDNLKFNTEPQASASSSQQTP